MDVEKIAKEIIAYFNREQKKQATIYELAIALKRSVSYTSQACKLVATAYNNLFNYKNGILSLKENQND